MGFDNVVKCFGGSLILYTTTVASMIFFGSRVDAGFVLGLMVYSVSSYFYAGDHNKRLETYESHLDEINALVKEKSCGGMRGTQLEPIASAQSSETDVERNTGNNSVVMG